MKTWILFLAIILCLTLLTGCGAWTRYVPVNLDKNIKWYGVTSFLELAEDSTYSVNARLPNYNLEHKKQSVRYNVNVYSNKQARTIVHDVFIEMVNDDNQQLIQPEYFEIFTVKGDFPNSRFTEIPDSLHTLKKGQHIVGYVGFMSSKDIEHIRHLTMRIYVYVTVDGKEVIIDRKIKCRRQSDLIVLLSV